ncbi:MAG: fused MFS/spermidine synthase [Planctomycetota bacterium]|nr:fused MFS/spermidine synthase [Planctomycetota bacterium]
MKRTAIFVALGVALVAAPALVWVSAGGAAAEQTVTRYDRESKYYRIRVVDYPDEGRRCLHFSKSRGIQSSMILAEPDKLDLRYSKSMAAALALHPAPQDVLLVGLGGASLPKFIQKNFPNVRLDIVEIDPDVVKTCQDWFEFKGTPNTRVIVMDGRMYLKRSTKQYDLILLDAYAADRVPFHLTTLEFIQLVKSRLKPGGLVASNLWEHSANRFYYAELRTFQTTFPQTYLCRSGDSGNIIVFGSLVAEPMTKEEWAKRAAAASAGKDFGFDLADLVAKEYEPRTTQTIDEKPLTDDMAPVDTLRRENPKHFEEAP